ncbi:MAG: hypothetical protein JNM91_14705 [Flavobacteriales bacterium]|nr:hypothetical protein [Flavobacteriales bacterium]
MKALLFSCALLITCSTATTPSAPAAPSSAQKETDRTRLVGSDLRIWPVVDTADAFNRDAIACLRRFLENKLNADAPNDYWHLPDFSKYGGVYPELLSAEFNEVGELRNWPTLLCSVPTDSTDQRLLTVRWAAEDSIGTATRVHYVFDFLARRTPDGVRLSFPIAYNTRDWERHDVGQVHYVVSPHHRFSPEQAAEQQRDIERLSRFFEVDPFPITFYSTESATGRFRAQGYQQHPLMHVFPTGGRVDEGGNVYSGNDKDIFTHEIIHLFVQRRFGATPGLLNEGVATMLGGLSEQDYAWHRAKMARYLIEHPDLDLTEHINTYLRELIDGETSLPYMVGALLCERILRTHGKAGLLQALGGGADVWKAAEPFGITRENMDEELRTMITQPMISIP